MRSAVVIAYLKRKGWSICGHKGSHVQLEHAQHAGKVIVPHPNQDIPVGTLYSIWKQAGLPWPPDLES